MKTVERKAKEYSEPIIYSYSDCRWCDAGELEEYIQDAYIAGYTEANKWISVEEGLPPSVGVNSIEKVFPCLLKITDKTTRDYPYITGYLTVNASGVKRWQTPNGSHTHHLNEDNYIIAWKPIN